MPLAGAYPLSVPLAGAPRASDSVSRCLPRWWRCWHVLHPLAAPLADAHLSAARLASVHHAGGNPSGVVLAGGPISEPANGPTLVGGPAIKPVVGSCCTFLICFVFEIGMRIVPKVIVTNNSNTTNSPSERNYATADELAIHPTHDCKGETTVDPRMGLPLGSTCMNAVSSTGAVEKLMSYKAKRAKNRET